MKLKIFQLIWKEPLRLTSTIILTSFGSFQLKWPKHVSSWNNHGFDMMTLKYRNTTHFTEAWRQGLTYLTNHFKLRFYALLKSKRYEYYFSNNKKSRLWIQREWNRATRWGSFLGQWDLIELRRYNFEAFMQTVKSKKIKFSGLINESKWKVSHSCVTLNLIKTWNSKMSKNYLYFWKVIFVMIIVFIVTVILIRHFTISYGTRDRGTKMV